MSAGGCTDPDPDDRSVRKLYGTLGRKEQQYGKDKNVYICRRVIKNLFKKPATTQYPFEPVEYPERMRGISGSKSRTVSPAGCAWRSCPSQAIRVDRKAEHGRSNALTVVQCGFCVATCPKKCLFMEKGYTEPDILKKSETFTKPKEEKKEAAAAAGGKPVMDAEKCVYCTLCAKKCPQEAIHVERKEKIWKLDEEKCVECGICAGACPKKAIELKG